MRQLMLIIAVVALVGCGESKEEKAAKAKSSTEAKGAAEAEAAAEAKAADKKPLTKEESARHAKATEAAIRKELKKFTGELTKADLEKVTKLELDGRQLTSVQGLEKLTQLTDLSLSGYQLTEIPTGLEKLNQLAVLGLDGNQLTDVKELEKLTQLKVLSLTDNPALTKAQIDQLKKALPKCKIYH
jgi:hypothetical protein